MPTLHLIIKGKVQGVFYRATAKEVADETGVTGWVKNTTDGSVEIVVSGSSTQLDEYLNWCKKGPTRANVTDLITTQIPEQTFTGFTVIR